MYGSLESRLLDKHKDLYLRIRQKSVAEYDLPINTGNKFVGFGLLLDFYMFWICETRGTVFFNSRIDFNQSRKNNVFRIEFDNSNQAAILEAIDKIYESYLESKINGGFQVELQRMETSKETRKNQNTVSDIQYLWQNVTSKTLEKAEQYCSDGNNDGNDVSQFENSGKLIVKIFDDILEFMNKRGYKSIQRTLAIYLEYIEVDTTTFSAIGCRHSLSRERIRQLVNHLDSRLFGCFKRAIRNNNDEYNHLIEQLASAFEEIDFDVFNLLMYGMNNVSSRKKQAIVNMFFGMDFSKQIFQEIKCIKDENERANELVKNEKRILEDWEIYRSKICYPSFRQLVDTNSVSSCGEEYRYENQKRFYNKLKKFEPIIKTVPNPDIIYYYSAKTDHRPHFLLILPDGTSVLVLLMSTINMGVVYNISRCNELHRFCKEKGYGYLILDDRGNSIYEIKNRRVDPELADCLNEILQSNNVILWKDVKDIMSVHKITNADIAAYVLQNKLCFTMNPFCIKKKSRT